MTSASIDFGQALVDWYREHKRDLPWRQTSDAYSIWVSEIMLQQTRVDQVIPYYERFMRLFPTVYALAEADSHDLMKAWEGLGYYSRARNLQFAAKQVVNEFNGKVPDTYEKINQLKGIGPYTSAAILSIAYNKAYAVVDGNVIRVLSRFFGVEEDVSLTSTKKYIQSLADRMLLEEAPSDFNQAMMELGATVCTPKKPSCDRCPIQAGCFAIHQLKTDSLPYKAPKKKVPHKQIVVGLIKNEKDELLISLRPQDVMLGGLWEFPGGKQEKNETLEACLIREIREEVGIEIENIQAFTQIKHAYSHFKITLHAFYCDYKSGEPKPKCSDEIRWVKKEDLRSYAFPKANIKLFDKLGI